MLTFLVISVNCIVQICTKSFLDILLWFPVGCEDKAKQEVK